MPRSAGNTQLMQKEQADMKNISANRIRRMFLDFFKGKGHEIVSSSPLVPLNDPSLLFTNAGMVQFKGVFLGEEKRPYTRATSCQKCVRAGGKHNDLENVGYTARHHTFFEMLGNFSFGDYFKAEAISFAWEFLTGRLGLPVDRLWVTVFEDDDEAAELWPRLTGISPERVVRLGKKDNFWAMGDTGPCGPCSEILIDQGPGVGCGRPDCRVGCDCDRYLELWNLVFMQFFRDKSGTLSPLPRPSIDTGMGLERIAAICQGVESNFDTDIFAGLLAHIGHLAGKTYGQDHACDVAMRVIADHARASAFLIADGVIPSNEGRGYVLRRIIRRAVRYGRVIGLNRPFMASVARSVVDEMSSVYPELSSASSFMAKVLEHEEVRFLETLEYGLGLLDQEITRIRSTGGNRISGDFAFKLYDTYGFPVDIVQDVAKEQGLSLDRQGFRDAMARQKERSKKARRGTAMESIPEIYSQLLKQGRGSGFVGYDTTTASSAVLALVEQGKALDKASEGWSGELVVEETPFYAESGGQLGDRGWIEGPRGRADVRDTIRRGDLIVHKVQVVRGEVAVGDKVALNVSEGLRVSTARNHTATHLLHAALRQVLGDHVKQAGSLVSPQRLRFDFTHFSAVGPDELRQVEDIVNERIREDSPVNVETVSHKEAVARGAMALFGEKYGDMVRVVTVPGFSMELCGGTHVGRTGQIGLFKIASESSVASGVRRIEALTAQPALDLVHTMDQAVSQAARGLNCQIAEVPARVADLAQKVKELEKALNKARIQNAAEDLGQIIARAQTVAGVKVLSTRVDLGDMEALRGLGDRLRDRLGSGVVALGANSGKKVLLLVMVTKDLVPGLHAGNLIKPMAKMVGGGGGGRPDMAQAGGSQPENLDRALEELPGLVEKALSS